MRVKWTEDVPLEQLRNLDTELGSDFEIHIDENPRCYKSASPPSWVRLFAEANWLTQLLGTYAALYVAKIVEAAAQDTWKDRGKIISAAVGAGGRVKQFAIALARLRKRLGPKTGIEIALPFPDDYDGTSLELIGTDESAWLYVRGCRWGGWKTALRRWTTPLRDDKGLSYPQPQLSGYYSTASPM
jgi:hypothetical protein